MDTTSKILRWVPRVLCILSLLFISMFALDAFDPGLPLSQQIPGFLMHMIPSFILLLALVIAWKWEFIGGIIFATIGLATTPFIYSLNYNRSHSAGPSLMIVCMVCLPFFVVGVLFILSHFRSKGRNEVSVHDKNT
jgi:hypothetical protein